MTNRAEHVLSALVLCLGVWLCGTAAGCNDEDTNLPFTAGFTPDPPLVTGAIPFFFTVQDVPGAPIQVAVQVSSDGGRTFQDATPVSGTAQLPAVLAQPEGANGVFYWDPLPDLGPGIHRDVILRVYGQGKELSAPADTAQFTVDLSDRLDPLPQGGPALTRPLAAPLPDGTAWVAGGLIGTIPQGVAQRYDPRTRTLTPEAGLSVPRDRPGWALLRGGQVLVAGGVESGGATSGAIELFRVDPASGAGRTDTVPGGLQVPRVAPAVATLPDGRGVVVGGDTGGGASTTLVELVAPVPPPGAVQGGFSHPLAARVGATATALPDGRVFVAGGFLNGQPVLDCALIDAAGTTISAGPSLPSPRGEHVALLLPDGRVALVGGTTVPGSDLDALATALVFDPLSGTIAPLPGMQRARRAHGAAVAGGQLVVFGGSGPAAPAAQPERLDLDVGQWFDVSGAKGQARPDAAAVAVGPGEALVVGGAAPPELYTPDASLTAESFDPLRSVPAARADHTATEVPGGLVLVVGGTAGVTSALATSEAYDPLLRTFTPRASLLTARASHAAAASGPGVLVVGGRGPNGVLGSAELWDPASDSWSPAGTLQVPRAACTLTPLLDGRFLVAGGVDQSGQPVAALEVWDPVGRAFSGAGTLGQPRGEHQALASLGDAVLGPGRDAQGQATGVAVVLPNTLQVQEVALDAPRAGAALGELLSGVVLVAGGEDAAGAPRADAAVVDARLLPFTTLTPTRQLLVARTRARAASLGVEVLLVGGRGRRGTPLDEAELYRFEPALPNGGSARLPLDRRQVKARLRHTVTRLIDGQVLIVGGVDERGVTIAGAELFRR